MCELCCGTGYIPKQQARDWKGTKLIYDVYTECECKREPKPEREVAYKNPKAWWDKD